MTAFLFFMCADWTVNVGFRVEEHNYIARKVCASSLVKKTRHVSGTVRPQCCVAKQ